MTILLHNLVACVPTLDDVDGVSELIHTCDIDEYGMPSYTRKDVLSDWQRPSFHLKTDAWTIFTTGGDLIGYAYVWEHEPGDILMSIHVHPDYRKRGVGTLLLRLAEERARQYANQVPLDVRVTLSKTVSNFNSDAQRLLQHEGYACVRQFWHVVIEMDDLSSPADEVSSQGKLKVAFDVDTPNPAGVTRLRDPSGTYVVRQQCTYEKELRVGEVSPANQESEPCRVSVLRGDSVGAR